jgi:hypothetical protein
VNITGMHWLVAAALTLVQGVGTTTTTTTSSGLEANEITAIVVGIGLLVVATLGQTVAFAYWAGQIKKGVAALELGQSDIKGRLTTIEANGSPVAQAAQDAADREMDHVAELRKRQEDHIAALGRMAVLTDALERRLVIVEARCASLHPPAGFQSRG